jgi:hypothetical protein
MIAASDNRIAITDSIPANDFDSLYSHDRLTVTQAVHAEQIVQGSIESKLAQSCPKLARLQNLTMN